MTDNRGQRRRQRKEDRRGAEKIGDQGVTRKQLTDAEAELASLVEETSASTETTFAVHAQSNLYLI